MKLGKKATGKKQNPQSKQFKSPVDISILPSFLALIIPLAVGFFILTTNNKLIANKSTELAQSYADQAMHKFEAQTLQYQDMFQSWGSNPRLIQAIKSNNSQLLAQISQEIKSSLPGVINVTLFKRGTAKLNKDAFPPINFSVLDMIKQTERKKPSYPEIQMLKVAPSGSNTSQSSEAGDQEQMQERTVLRIVMPIRDGDKVYGTILSSFDYEPIIKDLAPLNPNAGALTIKQQFPDSRATEIFTFGQPFGDQLASVTAKSKTPHWQAQFTLHKSYSEIHHNETLFWTAILIIGAICWLSAISVYFVFRGRLKKDLRSLERYFNIITAGETDTAPKFNIRYFNETAVRILDLIDALVAAQHTRSAKAKRTNKPASMVDSTLDLNLEKNESELFGFDSTEEEDSTSTPTGQTGDSRLDEIFRAYDIRGIVDETLTSDIVLSIGKAIGSEVLSQGESSIAVARDGRISGPELSQALIKGITSTGCNVINIGMTPTPLLYFAAQELNTNSGAMLTGSHNPVNYNGLKIVINGTTLANESLQALKHRIENNDFATGNGSVEENSVDSTYIDRIVEDVILARPMKVVVDAGNGVAGELAVELLTQLGCETIPLFCEIDGHFPNHHPDPSQPKNLEALIQEVKNQDAEIGIAFDGDGDRIGVVTNSGKMIYPDRLMMLFARDLLSRNPGADIIFDVKCTRDLLDMISNLGGRPIMWKTGHSLIKAKIKETGAILAGEMSGHIFFNDRWYGFDDALYSAARLLEVISMEAGNSDEVFDEFPEKCSTSELNIPVDEQNKFDIIEQVKKKGKFGQGKLTEIDGVRVDYDDSWGLVRASNTTPMLVCRFEGDNEEALDKVKIAFKNAIHKVDADLEIPF